MRMADALLITASLAACAPSTETALFGSTSVLAEFPDSVPMEVNRDSLLGFEWMRPSGLHVVRLNQVCSDSFPAPYTNPEWDEDGGPMVAAALTRVSLATVASAHLIERTPEGWKAFGRLGAANNVDAAAGSRWQLLTGSRDVGVPLEGGGMATDSKTVKVAVVDRGDGCGLALTMNFQAAEISDAVSDWQMMESIRFLDQRGRTMAALGWLDTLPASRRVGIARGGQADAACVSVRNGAVPMGTAVTTLEFLSSQLIVSYGVVSADPLGDCARVSQEPGIATHRVELVRSRYPYVSNAIAVLGVIPLDTTGNAIRSDVDGDGVMDRFGTCGSADGTKAWAWLVSESRPPRVIWREQLGAAEQSRPACAAALEALLR